MKITKEILHNRVDFLWSLRHDPHKKGAMRSDPKTGKPVFDNEMQKEGGCACGIMTEMFGQPRDEPDNKDGYYIDHNKPLGKLSFKRAKEALGVTTQQCQWIQEKLSDTPLTFPEIADRIEAEVFNKKP
jgi:hypothetical protein